LSRKTNLFRMNRTKGIENLGLKSRFMSWISNREISSIEDQ